MFRSMPFMTAVLGGVFCLAGETHPVFAQWDPWLLGPRYHTSYYAPSYYGGYWTGYAPAPAFSNCCYGPAPLDCCCNSGCSPCSGGNCASGNCSMNAAPPGSPKPIAEPENERPVPGRTNPGGRSTFDPNDDPNFESPNRTGTGTNLDDAKPFNRRGTGTGTGNTPPADNFRPRGTGTGTGTGTGAGLEGNPDPFENKANKPELTDPDLPAIPDRAPAAPANVKEEAPLDADLGLEHKMTNRPVLLYERQSLASRVSKPSVARTPARPRSEWSSAPVPARIARQ